MFAVNKCTINNEVGIIIIIIIIIIVITACFIKVGETNATKEKPTACNGNCTLCY